MTQRAKVVCTLGPASGDEETIRDLAAAGMAVARFNASHGTPETRRTRIERVTRVGADRQAPLATMLDLPGPEVRTATIDQPVALAAGDTVRFRPGETATDAEIGLSTSIAAAAPGDTVLVDDGRIRATVTEVDDETVLARIESGGELRSRAGVNVPDVDLGLPSVTDADRRELDVAAETPVDFVAASFVKTAADVVSINAELEERNLDVPIIAKIERSEAVENIDDIIAAADGIMVARGDLGVECPLEYVPIIQKRIIRRCHRAGVPVITATEILDSMVHENRPTRAEASDVANAVLDGTDAVMLSAETAVGDHPVHVVETMCRIIRDVEASEEYAEQLEGRVPPASETRTDALARSARYLARDLGASAIVTASESGYTARKIAKYRPSMPIVAATPDERVKRELALSWGAIPMQVRQADSADAIIKHAVQSAVDAGVVASGDTVVVVTGMMTEYAGVDTANMLKVHVASERIVSGRSVVSGFATGPVHRVGDGDISSIPEGSILAVPADFDDEFIGDLSTVAGIIDGHEGMTGYAAIVARELDVPTISHASLPADVADGREVTVDAERGVVYADSLEGRTRE